MRYVPFAIQLLGLYNSVATQQGTVMAKKMFGYNSYNFIDKDPIIDVLRTIVKKDGLDYNDLARDSGVSPTTLMAWMHGLTRSPRFVTLAAVFRAAGYDLIPSREIKVIPLRKRG